MSKINQTSNDIANRIDGISGAYNISVFWRDHFSSILNSSGSSNANLKNSVMRILDDVQYSENMIFSSRVTSKLICELESAKSSGPDHIYNNNNNNNNIYLKSNIQCISRYEFSGLTPNE